MADTRNPERGGVQLHAAPIGASDDLASVYDAVRAIARTAMAAERVGHTLQPTALANEAMLRLAAQYSLRSAPREQLIAIAARIIRRVLIDHARARNAEKRGGESRRAPLGEIACTPGVAWDDLLAIDESLDRLAASSPRQAQVVELRFYAGLSVEEAAVCLGVSERTVKDDWRFARAWLLRDLRGGEES